MPTTYEGGRHYVINVYPTLDMLKDIQTYPEVEQITGDHTLGSYAMHSIRMHRGGGRRVEDEQGRIREA